MPPWNGAATRQQDFHKAGKEELTLFGPLEADVELLPVVQRVSDSRKGLGRGGVYTGAKSTNHITRISEGE